MKNDRLLYEWDLPMRESDMANRDPDVLAKLDDMRRIERLYRIAANLEEVSPGVFVRLASAGSGPNIRKPNSPPLIAYCLLAFNPECVDDLISLGVELDSQEVISYIQQADQDVKDWWHSLMKREKDKKERVNVCTTDE